MNTRIILAGTDLIVEVATELGYQGKDYSSNLVIFPGKRPSHFLRKDLAARIGSSFIPPAIFSMDEFIDFLGEKLTPGRKLETIDAVALLYEIHSKAPNPLGGAGFMTPDNFFSLGLKIYRDIEEIVIEGINTKAIRGVESYIEEEIPEQTRGRLQSLSVFYEEFYKEIADRGFSTRSNRYWTVAEKIHELGLDKYKQIIFAGFFALTTAEKEIFKKLFLFENTLFIFQEGPGLTEQLEPLGISSDSLVKNCTEPEVHFYSSPDTHGQVLALGKILETKLTGGPLDEKTVIVLPSSGTLFPLVRQGLSSVPDEDYNISLGYPLHRTPIFGFLNNLMELVSSMDGDRVYIPDYLKFVLHPYTKNIYYKRKSETTRILFHAIEEELLRHKARTLITLDEIEGNRELFENVAKKLVRDETEIAPERLREHLRDIHRDTIESFLCFKNVGDFAQKCIRVLISIFNNSTACLHPLFLPFSESFIASLDLLSRSLMKDMAFEERTSYFTFFRKYIMTGHTPFSGTPVKGLQVLGFLETRNLKFGRVFVLDANEEIIPNSRKEETLLPFKVRKALGLPTYIDRDKLSAYYFDSLLKGGNEVHLFFVEDDRAERSRFVEKLLWEKQKKDNTTDAKPYIRPVQYLVSLANKIPEPIAKTPDMITFLKDFSYSATSLDQYLKCPLRFYYGSVLGISKKDEITGDIERSDLGNFVHDVLKSYFSKRKGIQLKAEDLNIEEMDDLIDELFERGYGKDPSGSVYLLKRQIKQHLADFLKDYYIPLAAGKNLTILENEEQIRIKIDSFNLKGRIDCVELRDEKTTIIDYKTGSNPNYLKINMEKFDIENRETWNKAIGSIQLPFYLLLYSVGKEKRIDELEALFLLLGSSKISNEIELPLCDFSVIVDTYKLLKEVIFKLLAEISDPLIPFSPATEVKKACPNCDFQYICGTQWIL